MYERLGVSYLLHEGDTIAAYEQIGRSKCSLSLHEQGMEALSNLNHVQKVELLQGICLYFCILFLGMFSLVKLIANCWKAYVQWKLVNGDSVKCKLFPITDHLSQSWRFV